MRPITAFVLLCLSATFLAGCNDRESAAVAESRGAGADEAAGSPGVGTPGALEAPVVRQSPTLGGDGSQIELFALTAEQLATIDLPGELACSFADADRGTLLVARADVLPDGHVRGVLSNNGFTEMLANGRAGGFNDLLDGITLAGKGLAVVLERGASQPTGDESTRHAATLTVQRADGAERTYDGTLTCGP